MDWNQKVKEMHCTTKECEYLAKLTGPGKQPDYEILTDILLRKSSNQFVPTPECNILILADRLFDLALGLKYYFYKYTNFNVLGVAASYEDAEEIILNKEVDLLIVCGYQACEMNYQVISMLRERMGSNVVMWALLDGLIHSICVDNCIVYKFSKYEPIDDFIAYLLDKNLVYRLSV